MIGGDLFELERLAVAAGRSLHERRRPASRRSPDTAPSWCARGSVARHGSRRDSAVRSICAGRTDSRRRRTARWARAARIGRAPPAHRTRADTTSTPHRGWRSPGRRRPSRGCSAGRRRRGCPARCRGVGVRYGRAPPGRGARTRSARWRPGSATARRSRRRPAVVGRAQRVLRVVERARRTSVRPASSFPTARARTVGCADVEHVPDHGPALLETVTDRPFPQRVVALEPTPRTLLAGRQESSEMGRRPHVPRRGPQHTGRPSCSPRRSVICQPGSAMPWSASAVSDKVSMKSTMSWYAAREPSPGIGR